MYYHSSQFTCACVKYRFKGQINRLTLWCHVIVIKGRAKGYGTCTCICIAQPTTIPNTSEREATFQTGISGACPVGCFLSLSIKLPAPTNHNNWYYTPTLIIHLGWTHVQLVDRKTQSSLLASLTSIVLLNLTLQHLDPHEGTEKTTDIHYIHKYFHFQKGCNMELTWSRLAAIFFRQGTVKWLEFRWTLHKHTQIHVPYTMHD